MFKTEKQLNEEYDEFLNVSKLPKSSADELLMEVAEESAEIELLPQQQKTITQQLRATHLNAYRDYLVQFIKEWEVTQEFESARWGFDNKSSQETYEALREQIEIRCPGFMKMYVEVNGTELYSFASEEK